MSQSNKYYLRSKELKYSCAQPQHAVSLPQNFESQSESLDEEEIIYFQSLNNTLMIENDRLIEETNKKDIKIHKITQERNKLRNENIILRQTILDLKIQINNLRNDINFVRNVVFCLAGFFVSCMGYYLYRRIPFGLF
jgi:hypothetical protein